MDVFGKLGHVPSDWQNQFCSFLLSFFQALAFQLFCKLKRHLLALGPYY